MEGGETRVQSRPFHFRIRVHTGKFPCLLDTVEHSSRVWNIELKGMGVSLSPTRRGKAKKSEDETPTMGLGDQCRFPFDLPSSFPQPPLFLAPLTASIVRNRRGSVGAEQLSESVKHNERPGKLANRRTKIGSRPEESLSFRGSGEIRPSRSFQDRVTKPHCPNEPPFASSSSSPPSTRSSRFPPPSFLFRWTSEDFSTVSSSGSAATMRTDTADNGREPPENSLGQ